MAKAKRRGRPPHEATPDTRKYVEGMTAYGMTAEDICTLMEMSKPTLYKFYRPELDKGHLRANAKVGQSLFLMATEGTGREKVAAAIFWAKTRMGWTEKHALEHSGSIDGPIQIHITPQESRF